MNDQPIAKLLIAFALFLFFISTPLEANHLKNNLIVCDNGQEMFEWDLEFLSQAEESVEVLACFFGGKTACDLLEAIELRLIQVPHLQVHLLVSPILMKDKEWFFVYRLRQLYPNNFHMELTSQVIKFLPELITIDNHTKLFVVDEFYFSAGGTNLEEKHCSDGTYTPARDRHDENELDRVLPAGMRDQDVVGSGPLAQELRRGFFQLYCLWEHYNLTKCFQQDPVLFENQRYFKVAKKNGVKRFETAAKLELEQTKTHCIFSGPYQAVNAITKEYLRLIREAKDEIIIANLYFFPVPEILQALMDAVNRGVRLTVITNGLSETTPLGSKFFAWGNRISYVPILYGEIYRFWDLDNIQNFSPKDTHIYEYNVDDVLLHKKMMIIDNSIFLLGSYNLGLKSAYGDYELVLVFDSPEMAQEAKKIHMRDLEHSRKISLEEALHWYFDPCCSYYGELQKKMSGFL